MKQDLIESVREGARRYEDVAQGADAEGFSRMALRRCRANLEMLVARLRAECFPDVNGLLPRASIGQLTSLREVLGHPPPRILELFWEEVGGIELTMGGVETKHAVFFDERGIVPDTPDRTTDALVVSGLSASYLQHLGEELEPYREEMEDFLDDLDDEESGFTAEDAPTFLIPLCPDHLHKDNISGSGPCGVELVDHDWLPRFTGNFAWVGSEAPSLAPANPDFMSYLRAAIIECAGFPGLLGTPAFEPLRKRLTMGFEAF